MTTYKHLDYIQASCLISEHEVTDKKFQKCPAIAYYKRGYRNEQGTRFYFGNPKSNKALLVCSGSALEEIRGTGIEDGQILQSLFEKDATITRLDTAITVEGDEDIFALGDVETAYQEGKIDSPLCERGGTLISKLTLDKETYPETFYIGDLAKRGKKGLFRAYDKGAMLDITRQILMRLELEERGSNAHMSAKRIAGGASVASVMKSRFNIKTDQFQAIYDADSVEIARGKAKEVFLSDEEKRWKWLIEQVAPTLKKSLMANQMDVENDENFTRFLSASGLGEKINELVLVRLGKK